MRHLLKYSFLIVLAITISSCESYIGDTNTNPNSAIAVPPKLLLPTIQATINYAIAGDGTRFAGIYTQQLDGINRQFVAYQNYTIRGGDFDALWQQNLYGALKDIQNLKEISTKNSYDSYNGMAKVLEAHTLLFLTDFFGDIPYSDALQGFFVNPAPKFDSQSEIFASIFNLLTEAKAHFGAGADDAFKPGADDLIFGGNLVKWNSFANAIEARGRLHLAKKDPAQYALALVAAKLVADVPSFQYSADPTGNAPFYQYNEQRQDIVIGDSYVALMASLNDPRVETYGADLNESHPILTSDQNVPFIRRSEIDFIIAECLFRGNLKLDAKAAYIAAIKSSMAEAKITEGVDTYLAQSSVTPSGDITLEQIMTQKYIAMFMESEASCDWRRTGIPVLTPNTGNSIPRRFAYPQTEVNYNPNTPKYDVVNIFTPVAWDN